MYPKHHKKFSIYFLGGTIHVKNMAATQDVALVENGSTALSFIQAKQSSSQSNLKLNDLVQKLKN
jgi:hypothetical protein